VWSPARGLWSMRNGRTGAITSVVIGRGGDIPVPGDYDGDRRDDIAVWRPSSGTWFIRESSHGGALRIVQWGALGDLPVPADFSGDLVTDFAVWHAATGSWQILTNVPGDEYSGPVREVFWGDAGDMPINGNFIGDDLADFVVWSPVWGWRILENHQLSEEQVRIGERGDVPMPVERGVDGDLDPAVFRTRDGFWQVSDSATGALSLFPFGATGDIPVGRRR
jgi:hypothetical protein